MPDATAPLRFEYVQEMPRRRSVPRRESGPLVGHIAGHEKLIGGAGAELQIRGSGDRPLEVSLRRCDPETQRFEHGMLAVGLYRTLTEKPPARPIDLRGPLF